MKRIWFTMMVLLAVLVWGVGAAPLSGELESTIEFNPSSSGFGDFLADITSTVSVKYAFNGWEFGSKSTYDLDGLALQEFTAFGRLGAFTIDSTMKFDPHVIATVTYALPCGTSCYQTQSVTGVTSAGAPATWTQSIWNCPTLTETATYTAAFSSFEAMAQTFLWGLNLEGLFYLKGDDFEAKTMTGKWVYGNPFAFCGVPPCVMTQTGSYTASACLPRYGAGWKYTFSGMIGDILITSRSYFNLEEYTYNELMAKAYAKTYLADTLKLGGSYYLPKVGGETCQVGFTREFITLEGMNLGCAEFDVGLKFTCAGFDWFKILITGAELSSCISFDALITFGITQTQSYKAIAIEPKVKIGNTGCFSFQLALDYTGTTTAFSLNALKINGISMSYTWNGLTFTSVTSFNPVYGSLGGYYLADDVASPTTYGFFIPDKNFTKDKFNISTGEGYYTQVCFPEEYYDIWEMLILEGQGDGCCGGRYNWAIKTYFGDRKVLIADSFWFWYKDEDGHSYQYNPATPATRTEPAVLGSGAPYCEDDDVTYGVAYYDAPGDTLFGWVKTDAELYIPISANFDLTFSMAVNVYGLEGLKLGFSFRW